MFLESHKFLVTTGTPRLSRCRHFVRCFRLVYVAGEILPPMLWMISNYLYEDWRKDTATHLTDGDSSIYGLVSGKHFFVDDMRQVHSFAGNSADLPYEPPDRDFLAEDVRQNLP